MSSRIGLGIIFLSLAGFCFAAALDGAGVTAFLAGLFCAGAWVYYATLVVDIDRDFVVVRRFWRPIWRADTRTVSATIAKGGELKTHRCLRLTSQDEAKAFDILQSQFGRKALEQISTALEKS